MILFAARLWIATTAMKSNRGRWRLGAISYVSYFWMIESRCSGNASLGVPYFERFFVRAENHSTPAWFMQRHDHCSAGAANRRRESRAILYEGARKMRRISAVNLAV